MKKEQESMTLNQFIRKLLGPKELSIVNFEFGFRETATTSVDGVNQLDDAHQCIGLRVGRYLYYAGPASRNIRGQDNKVSSMTEETPVIILEDNLRAWQSIITGIYHGHG